MCFLKKEEVRELKTREELQEALQFFKCNDCWLYPYANEIKAFGVSNHPLFNSEKREEIREECPSDDFDDSFEECVREAGLFLTVPDGSRFLTFPARYTALESIYDRSGTNCRIIRNVTDRKYTKALSAEERAEIIARGFRTSKEPVKLLISDGMVSFIGSEKYMILPYEDGVEMAERTLADIFETVEYKTGYVSHEFLSAEWVVESDETLSHQALMKQYGVLGRDDSVKYIFRFSSSNIGNAKMSGRMLVNAGGCLVPLGFPQSVWHLSTKAAKNEKLLDKDNGCSIKDLEYKFNHFLAASLKENEEVIEILGNTPVYHPDGCMQRLLAFCPSIPANLKAEAIDQAVFLGHCTAMDVYLGIAQIQGKMKNLRNLVQVTEEIAQLQAKDFALFDKPKKEDGE